MPIHADLSVCINDLESHVEADDVQEDVAALLAGRGCEATVTVDSTWGDGQ